jgi:hypothetical protein
MKIFIVLSFALSALAQSGLDVPQAGWMVDHSGAVRAVAGFAQSFLVSAQLRTDALSAACSSALCLVKTPTSLVTSTSADAVGLPAPPGPALFSIRGQTALIFFPAANQFARFKEGQLRFLDWTVEGEVLALRITPDGPEFAVQRDGGVWIVARDGSIQAALPADVSAVVLVENMAIFSNSRTLVVRRADGRETSFDLPGVVALSPLGASYVQVNTPTAIYALRIDPGHEQLAVLPDTGASQ